MEGGADSRVTRTTSRVTRRKRRKDCANVANVGDASQPVTGDAIRHPSLTASLPQCPSLTVQESSSAPMGSMDAAEHVVTRSFSGCSQPRLQGETSGHSSICSRYTELLHSRVGLF